MRVYDINLTMDGENLSASPNRITMGSRYDNLMHRLVFHRPPQLADCEMILQFQGPEISYAPLNRGSYSDFVVPNILMLANRLDLQLLFQRGDSMIHSNWIEFSIRESLCATGVAIEPWPLPSGPPGPAPFIGENGNWFQWEGSAFADTGVPARGSGEGGGITVNGIAPAQGNISLGAEQIPYGEESVAAALEQLLPYLANRTVSGCPAQIRLMENGIEGITLEGAAGQRGTPEPENPLPIFATPACVQVSGPNLAALTQQGGLDAGSGQESDSGAVLRTDFIPVGGALTAGLGSGWEYTLLGFDSAQGFAGCLQEWTTQAKTVTHTGFVRLAVRRFAGGDFSLQEAPQAKLMLTCGTAALPYRSPAVHLAHLADTFLYGPPLGQDGPRDTWDTTGTIHRRWGIVRLADLAAVAGSTGTAGISRMRYLVPNMKPNSGNSALLGLYCTHFKEVNASQSYSKVTGIAVDTGGVVWAYHPDYNTSAEAFNAWVAREQPVLVYPLASPTAEAVAPRQWSSPQGDVVASAAGELTLTTARLATTRDLDQIDRKEKAVS